MSDTLGTARVQSDLCNLPHESKQQEMFLYTGTVYSVAILLVALRIGGKIVSNHISMDDWIVIAALLLLALPVGCVLAMTKIGFGKHLWSLGNGELLRILRLCKSSYKTL
jgi:small neutral amino acid transporter SnatA (MarC family)